MNTTRRIAIFLAMFSSLAPNLSIGSDYVNNNELPIPIVEIKYQTFDLTKDLIIEKAFADNQLVPLTIDLLKPTLELENEADVYLLIESVQVLFAVRKTSPITSDSFKGHLMLIPLRWAPGFKLESGSRIVFEIKYNYMLGNEILENGNVVKEINF